MADELEQRGINVIRGLAMDAVQKANSGHPGTPDGARPARARAVDADHEVRRVRSRLARPRPLRPLGRPRVDAALLDAVPHRLRARARRPEAVPAVGLGALRATPSTGTPRASRSRPARSARASRTRSGSRSRRSICASASAPELCDHRIFGIASDGDFMEGISHEAASLAGHLKLGRIVFVYDDNHITIDGPTELAYTDDVAEAVRGVRLARGASWARSRTISTRSKPDSAPASRRSRGRRCSCCVRTSATRRRRCRTPRPRTATRSAPTRSPRSRRSSACPPKTSTSPTTCCSGTARPGRRSAPIRAAWDARPKPDEFEACLSGEGLHGWEQKLPTWQGGTDIATRVAIEEVLSAVVDVVPGLFTASGDLTGNTGMQSQEPRHVHARRRQGPARSTSASASTPWARAANAMARRRTRAVRRHVLRVQRLHAPDGAPGRRSCRRRSASCGRTTRWASARTARRTNRSSSSPSLRAMPGSAGHPPGRRERGRGRVEGPPRRRRTDRADPHPPEGPGARPDGRAGAGRRARRRVRAVAREPRPPRRRADRYRFGGAGLRGRARAARDARDLGARRVDAVVGPLRATARRVPRRGAPARRAHARRRGRRCGSGGSATPTTW